MTAAPVHDIPLDAVDVTDRLRLVDRAHAEMIAASIAESYLHQPIAVTPGPAGSNRYVLVDGEHRLEAVRLLGRTTIAAVIRDLTREEREKHEIHANLIRNELSALDRMVFVGRLADIFAAEHPAAKNGGDRKSLKFQRRNQLANLANWSSFSTEAARRTGLSERSIRRTRELLASIAPEAIALIRATALADNAAQLKALADLDPADQIAVAREIADGRAASVAKARVSAGQVPEGGAVREEDRLLRRIEAILPRLSVAGLKTLAAMVETQQAGRTLASKKARQ